jgi:hypothetical protein
MRASITGWVEFRTQNEVFRNKEHDTDLSSQRFVNETKDEALFHKWNQDAENSRVVASSHSPPISANLR